MSRKGLHLNESGSQRLATIVLESINELWKTERYASIVKEIVDIYKSIVEKVSLLSVAKYAIYLTIMLRVIRNKSNVQISV